MKTHRRHLPAVVYRITNLVNGKFYIGVTTNRIEQRLREHFSAALQTKKVINGAFQKAIRKYGKGAFSIEIIIECDTAEVALQEEVRLIGELHPHYNSTLGGDGSAGHTVTAEGREKIAQIWRGKRGPMYGRKHTDKTIEILRQHGIDGRELFSRFSHLGPASVSRPVMCVDDGERFPSASAAAKRYGVAKSAVIELCLGQRGRRSVGGKVFRYVEDA